MTAHTPSLYALEELHAIKDFVLDAQATLKSGRMPDLAALEERTSDLCRIIQQTSSDMQLTYVPELKELVRELDTCEQQLRSLYETIATPPETKQ